MNFMEKYFLNFSLSLDPVALSLRKAPFGAYNTVYLARSCRRSTHICLRFTTANIRYTETLSEIAQNPL